MDHILERQLLEQAELAKLDASPVKNQVLVNKALLAKADWEAHRIRLFVLRKIKIYQNYRHQQK